MLHFQLEKEKYQNKRVGDGLFYIPYFFYSLLHFFLHLSLGWVQLLEMCNIQLMWEKNVLMSVVASNIYHHTSHWVIPYYYYY